MPCNGVEWKWTKEQWMIFLVMGATHFLNGMCVSIQAPFYPPEAEKKGANATEFGLVFGIFELTVFIVSPLMGTYVPKIGAMKSFCIGMVTTGTACIAFGFLDYIQDSHAFIALSFMVRILEAIGNAAFLTSSFSIVAEIFPSAIASVFSYVEMCFGLGLIIGPTLGGALYDFGGFLLPFVVLGSLLVMQALAATLCFKRYSLFDSKYEEEVTHGGLLRALVIPRVGLANFTVFTASISIGFLMTTLERHLEQFKLSSIEVGMFFMSYGMAYAFPNPLWGFISDNFSPRFVTLLGSIFLTIGFLFVGPLPVTNLNPSYWLSLAMLVVAGIGIGAQLGAGFTDSQRCAVANGYPNDLTTYSLISSLWTSSFALGAFIGPMAAGSLYDLVGFRWSTLFGVVWNHLVTWLTVISLICSIFATVKNKRKLENYSKLDEELEDNTEENLQAKRGKAKKKPSLILDLDIPEDSMFKPGSMISPSGARYTPTEVLFSPTRTTLNKSEEEKQLQED